MAYYASLLGWASMFLQNTTGATTTAVVSATLTGVNYATKEADAIKTSVLEYSVSIFTTSGIDFTLSIRDTLFITTALITIGATLRIHALNVKKKRRRHSDRCSKCGGDS